MVFKDYSQLKGQHAFLSASKHSWINYDEDRLITAYKNFTAAQLGTRLHDFACEAIKLGIKLPRSKQTLRAYVNDAIGFHMTPEQTLYFSENCFGTADAISFNNGLLRIHDLKTGVTPASMDQLRIYAALFCLNYNVRPGDIAMELRIYQSDDVMVFRPEVDDILPIMDKIITFDKCIDKMREEALGHGE